MATDKPNPLFQPQRFRTTDQLVEFQSKVAAIGRGIMGPKNRDYGDTENNDPFANLRIDGPGGIVVRMQDKLSRLRTFTKKGRLTVEEESVYDTAIDLMNYATIFLALIADEQYRREKDQL